MVRRITETNKCRKFAIFILLKDNQNDNIAKQNIYEKETGVYA